MSNGNLDLIAGLILCIVLLWILTGRLLWRANRNEQEIQMLRARLDNNRKEMGHFHDFVMEDRQTIAALKKRVNEMEEAK